MSHLLTQAIAILLLCGTVGALGACHTVQGAGQDISATGNTIDNAAKKTTP